MIGREQDPDPGQLVGRGNPCPTSRTKIGTLRIRKEATIQGDHGKRSCCRTGTSRFPRASSSPKNQP